MKKIILGMLALTSTIFALELEDKNYIEKLKSQGYTLEKTGETQVWGKEDKKITISYIESQIAGVKLVATNLTEGSKEEMKNELKNMIVDLESVADPQTRSDLEVVSNKFPVEEDKLVLETEAHRIRTTNLDNEMALAISCE